MCGEKGEQKGRIGVERMAAQAVQDADAVHSTDHALGMDASAVDDAGTEVTE